MLNAIRLVYIAIIIFKRDNITNFNELKFNGRCSKISGNYVILAYYIYVNNSRSYNRITKTLHSYPLIYFVVEGITVERFRYTVNLLWSLTVHCQFIKIQTVISEAIQFNLSENNN